MATVTYLNSGHLLKSPMRDCRRCVAITETCHQMVMCVPRSHRTSAVAQIVSSQAAVFQLPFLSPHPECLPSILISTLRLLLFSPSRPFVLFFFTGIFIYPSFSPSFPSLSLSL